MRHPRRALAALLGLVGAACFAPLLLAASCGGAGNGAGGGGGSAGTGTTTTLHPDAQPLAGESRCTVIETTDIPEPDFTHVPICTTVDYATNPPSGGNHWPIWAAYTKYDVAIPREMSVHDLEHGAIVLAYRCEDACPDVVAALTTVFDGMTADPLCAGPPSGPSARMVLTPDPELGAPIAAASWGATYTATCIDLPSLQAFAKAHYGQGREDFCTDGLDLESVPSCAVDGGDGG